MTHIKNTGIMHTIILLVVSLDGQIKINCVSFFPVLLNIHLLIIDILIRLIRYIYKHNMYFIYNFRYKRPVEPT